MSAISKMAKQATDRAGNANGGTIVFTAIIGVSALLSAIFFWRHSAQVFAGLPVLLATALGLIIGLLPSEGAFFGWKAMRKANEEGMTSGQMFASNIGLWSGVIFAVANIIAIFVTSFPEVPAAIRDMAAWIVFFALMAPIPTQFLCYALFVMSDADVQDAYRRSVLHAARQKAIHMAELAKIGSVIQAAEKELERQLPSFSKGAAEEEVSRLLAGKSAIYLPASTQDAPQAAPSARNMAVEDLIALLASEPQLTARALSALGVNTQDVARFDPSVIPLAVPTPGQGLGNGPAAKPLGADARNPTSRP